MDFVGQFSSNPATGLPDGDYEEAGPSQRYGRQPQGVRSRGRADRTASRKKPRTGGRQAGGKEAGRWITEHNQGSLVKVTAPPPRGCGRSAVNAPGRQASQPGQHIQKGA